MLCFEKVCCVFILCVVFSDMCFVFSLFVLCFQKVFRVFTLYVVFSDRCFVFSLCVLSFQICVLCFHCVCCVLHLRATVKTSCSKQQLWPALATILLLERSESRSNLDNLNEPRAHQDISASQFGFCPWYPRRFFGPSFKSLRFLRTNSRIHYVFAKILVHLSLGSVHGILGASSDLRSRAFDFSERTVGFIMCSPRY